MELSGEFPTGLSLESAFVAVRRLPDPEDVFVLAFIPQARITGFEVPTGTERQVFSIRGAVSPELAPGAVSEIVFTDGPDGEGFGELKLQKELSSRGQSRLPGLVPGAIRIVKGRPILRGDANHDGRVDISDAVLGLNFLFLGGLTPVCMDEADANDDGALNISDSVSILNTLFLGEPGIAPPFPDRGLDPTVDDLPECLELRS